MPIHEYECRRCGCRFEALIRGSDTASCPECKSTELEQLLSLFAVSSEATRQSALRDGKKRQRKVTREKAIADQEEIDHHRH